MNSGCLESELVSDEQALQKQIGSLKVATVETREQLELDRARQLKEQGKLDEAMTVCRDLLVSGKNRSEQRWFQQAKHFFEELIIESRRSKEQLSPHSLLESVLQTSDRSASGIKHLELLCQQSNSREISDSFLKSEKFTHALQFTQRLMSSSNDEKLVSLYLTFLNNVVTNASDSQLKQFDLISNITVDTSNFSNNIVSLFVKLPVTFCQRAYSGDDKAVPKATVEFIDKLIIGFLKSDLIAYNDIAFSCILKLWINPAFCEKWIDNEEALKNLVTMFFKLHVAHKLKEGHLAMVFRFLHDAAAHFEKDFSKHAVTMFNSYFDTDRNHAIQLLAIMFSGVSEVASQIFNQPNVIGDLVDQVEGEPVDVQIGIVELFSEACSSTAARESMRHALIPYLKSASANNNLPTKLKSLASLVLSKLACADIGKVSVSSAVASDLSATDHRHLAKNLLEHILQMNEDDVSFSSIYIEGLSFLSNRPTVKELLELQSNRWISKLQVLLRICKSNDNTGISGSVQYGIALILDSLCMYKRKKSKEEQQVQKLKEFAKEVHPDENDPRDVDSAVEKRIRILIENGMLRILVSLSSNESSSVTELVARTWNNCARDPTQRGRLAQEGAIKALLNIYNNDPCSKKSLVGDDTDYPFTYAANAISLIAISLDPHVAYPSTAANMVKPLISILKSENGLYQFESLLALTNLAGMDDGKVGDVAVSIRKKLSDKASYQIVEDLILSDHPKIQCAAVELLCNLMSDNECRGKWVCYRGEVRTKILLALADAEEAATRKSAASCLAMLVYDKEPRRYLKSFEKTVPTILALVMDGDVEIVWRAVFLLTGICSDAESTVEFVQKASAEQLNVLAHGLMKASQSSHPQVAEMSRSLLQRLTNMGLKIY